MSNGMRVIAPFDLSSTSPLDSRQKWPSYDALEHNTTVKMPNGFHAYCVAEDKWYQLSCTDENSIATYLWFADNMFGDTEQSTLAANTTAISGLNDDIGALASIVSETRHDLVNADAEIEGAKENISSLSQSLNALASTVGGVASDAGYAKDGVDNLSPRMSTAEQEISKNDSAIDSLNGDLNLYKDYATPAISTLQQTTSDLVVDVGKLEDDLVTINQRIDNNGGAIFTLDQTVTGLNQDVETLQRDVETAEGQIDRLNTSVGTQGQSLQTLQQTVTELNQEYGHSKDDITALQTTTSGLSTSVNALDDRIDAVDEDITSIEQTLITKVDSDKIGAASGITPLDANQMIPIQYIPNSVIEKMKIVADDAARFALTKAEVQNGDTVQVETTIVEGEVITGLMYYVHDDNHLDNESGYHPYTAGMATTAHYAETAPATGVSFTDESYSSTTVAAALVEVMAEKDALEETVTGDISDLETAVAGKMSTTSVDIEGSIKTYSMTVPIGTTVFFKATGTTTDLPTDYTMGVGFIQRPSEREVYIEFHNTDNGVVFRMYATHDMWSDWFISPEIKDTETSTTATWSANKINTQIEGRYPKTGVTVTGSIRSYAVTDVSEYQCLPIVTTVDTLDVPTDIDEQFNMCTGTIVARAGFARRITLNSACGLTATCWCSNADPQVWSDWYITGMIDDTVTNTKKTWSSSKITEMLAGKASNAVATNVDNGLMSSEDKVKLNGIADNANNYSLPAATLSTLGGVKIGANLTVTADGVLAGTPNTTYGEATTSASGLMSSADKTKLNGVADNANNYSLPTASASTLGGMKVGDGLKIDTGGILSLNAQFVGTQAEWEAFDKTDFPDKGIVIITDD